MKRFIPILLVVVTLLSVLIVVGFSSAADNVDEDYYVIGEYTYCVLGSTDAKIVGYSGSATELTIPEKFNNYKVTYIGDFAFMECNFNKVTVPKSLINIGDNAFVACDNLTDITILNAECEIFDSEYTIPENVTIHGYSNSTAFDYASKYDKAFVSIGDSPITPTQPSSVKPTETEPTVPSETETQTEPTTPSETKPASPDQVEPTNPTQPIVTILGDVDLDGQVSVMDATAIQLHIADILTLSEDSLKYADADKDGSVSVMDATQIQLFVAQIIPEL